MVYVALLRPPPHCTQMLVEQLKAIIIFRIRYSNLDNRTFACVALSSTPVANLLKISIVKAT